MAPEDAQEQHRRRLVRLILSASTPAEIAETRRELRQWVEQHPGDLGLTDGFDHLAMSEVVARAREGDSAGEVAQKQAA